MSASKRGAVAYPETNVIHRLVTTLIAVSLVFECPVKTLAIALLAEVVTKVSREHAVLDPHLT